MFLSAGSFSGSPRFFLICLGLLRAGSLGPEESLLPVRLRLNGHSNHDREDDVDHRGVAVPRVDSGAHDLGYYGVFEKTYLVFGRGLVPVYLAILLQGNGGSVMGGKTW